MLVMTAHFYAKHNYYLMMANIHSSLLQVKKLK